MEELIIEAVRPHVVLYDTSHPDYMKTKLKQEIWNTIANDVNAKNGKHSYLIAATETFFTNKNIRCVKLYSNVNG